MSYNITLPNGNTLGTIADGTYDNKVTTSLQLVGRNYSNYGQFMTNNLVALLANFAYGSAPASPQVGQLWWDSANNILKVCYANSPSIVWKVVGGATAQSSAPSSTVAGDLWYDTLNKQLYVNDVSSGWILVGPGYSALTGESGAIWEQIVDTVNTSHDVVSIYLDGTRTAIIAAATFTPNVAISGFSSINSGWNMNSADTIYGTANNSNNLGGIAAANYWNSTANNTGTGSLSVLSNVGIALGSAGLFYANVNAADGSGRLFNTFSGGNVSFYVNATSGGVTRGLYVSGADSKAYVAADPTGALGVATKQYVDNSFVNANLTGVPTAPTMPAGAANTSIATTAFVINNSGFKANLIYQGNSSFGITDTGTGSANLQIDGTSVLTASASGVNLLAGATAQTQSQTYYGSGDTTVATTSYVKTATQWWNGSAKFVSNAAPVLGVNDAGSNNGDFWFQLSN